MARHRDLIPCHPFSEHNLLEALKEAEKRKRNEDNKEALVQP
jgi:hypothetical protein